MENFIFVQCDKSHPPLSGEMKINGNFDGNEIKKATQKLNVPFRIAGYVYIQKCKFHFSYCQMIVNN